MKDDLVGNLVEGQGGLGGLSNIFAHIGREPGGGRGLQTPPGWGLSRGTLLQHPVEGKLSVQARLFLFHLQASDFVHFTDVRCVQHWNTVKRLGPVPGGPVLGRPQGWSPEFLSSI